MTTDPIADLLVRLRNASMVQKADVSIPRSALKAAVAELLAKEGYVASVESKKAGPISVSLKYHGGRPAINGVRRISKPSRRVYLGVGDIHSVKRGHGLLVLSTPEGLMTGKEARAKHVGGEALFEIW